VFSVRTHLWDLSGASEYLDVRNELYVGADVVLVIFDATDLGSFESLPQWLQEVKKFGPSDVQLCIVANKVKPVSKRLETSFCDLIPNTRLLPLKVL